MNYERSNNSRVYGANPSANADFDLAYNHITTFDQGSMRGAYTVRAGDTLQGIAANLWGDASLWWKIAEANGLSGQSTLAEGQSLLLPVGVQRESVTQTLLVLDCARPFREGSPLPGPRRFHDAQY